VKKLLLALALFVPMLAACGPKAAPILDPALCQLNWDTLTVPEGDEGILAHQIINEIHLPNSVGDAVKTCLLGGWRWADPTPMPPFLIECRVVIKIYPATLKTTGSGSGTLIKIVGTLPASVEPGSQVVVFQQSRGSYLQTRGDPCK